MSRTLGWLLACALLSACSSSTPLTQIMVVVRSDIELARADIVVDGLGKQQVASAKLSKQKLPRTLAIVYRGGPLGPITVRARGYDASDTLLVERVAKLSFVRGRNVTLVLDLAQQCVGVSCPGGDTCIAGGCSDFKVDSKKLQDWPGAVGKVDAGTIVMGGDAAADGGELDAMVSNPDSGGSFGGDAAMDAGSDAEIDSGQVITGCDADHADCNKDGVCETSLTTTDDCGGCNKKCDFDNNVVAPAGTLSCPKQVCKVTCPSDRIDFDHKPGTGCEGTAFTYVPAHVDMDDATVRS
ncbi:MAG TPA: hypothetical protein VHM19_19455, partial [Polyangiales bacterium]|nr:hypothetical protein [Polyangiales bacterium]